MQRTLDLGFVILLALVLCLFQYSVQLGGYVFTNVLNHKVFLIVVAYPCCWLFLFSWQKKGIRFGPAQLVFSGFLVAILFSFVLSGGEQQGLYIIFTILFILSALVASNSDVFLRLFFWVLVLCGAYQALLGLQQVLWGFDLSGLQFSSTKRPTGVFFQVNVLASFLATASAVSTWWHFNSKVRFGQLLNMLALLFMLVAIWVSQSRAGLLGYGLFCISLIVWLISRKQLSFLRVSTWFVILLLSVLLSLAYNVGFEALHGESIDRSEAAVSRSTEIRLITYKLSLEMVSNNPLGVGVGNFPGEFVRYFYENKSTDLYWSSGKNYGHMYHPHNEWLMLAVQGGWLTSILILFCFVFLIFKYFRYGISKVPIEALLVIPIAVHSFVEMPFYVSFLHLFIFLVLIFASLNKNDSLWEVPIPSIVIYVSPILLAILLFFSITGFMTLQSLVEYSQNPRQKELMYELKNPFILQQEVSGFLAVDYLNSAITIGDRKMVEGAVAQLLEASKVAPSEPLFISLLNGLDYLGDSDNKASYYLGLLKKVYGYEAKDD